jgi:hypothetical protein
MDARRGSVESAETQGSERLLLVGVPGERPREGLSAEGCAPEGVDTMDLRRFAKRFATLDAVRR